MNGSASCRWQGRFCMEVTPLPCLLTVFGALGDLAHRKLFPALYHLHRRRLLHGNSAVAACGRREMSDDDFRAYVRGLPGLAEAEPRELETFLRRIRYHAGDYTRPDTFSRLAALLAEMERTAGDPVPGRIYYLAVSPELYLPLTEQLAQAGLLAEPCESPDCSQWRHAVFEKPFGFDLASAVELEQGLLHYLAERQIYRIDHYLGKETVQNILMFRFANRIFEPVWNRDHIGSVGITVAETVGVEHRAGYFDRTGLLRDMFQNHMLEMLMLAAMDCPVAFEADRIRDEKARLLRSLRPPDPKDLLLGQYAAGNGMKGYRDEPGVPPDSRTETFAALKVFVDKSRWKGVPFYLCSGKRLNEKRSSITVNFKPVTHSIFPGIREDDLAANRLILTVQPEEGLTLEIIAKKPGPKLCMGELAMEFNYASVLGPDETMPDAYERLLLDCMLGDQTLFLRSDTVRLAWEFLAPALAAKNDRVPVLYPAGCRPEEVGKR